MRYSSHRAAPTYPVRSMKLETARARDVASHDYCRHVVLEIRPTEDYVLIHHETVWVGSPRSQDPLRFRSGTPRAGVPELLFTLSLQPGFGPRAQLLVVEAKRSRFLNLPSHLGGLGVL